MSDENPAVSCQKVQYLRFETVQRFQNALYVRPGNCYSWTMWLATSVAVHNPIRSLVCKLCTQINTERVGSETDRQANSFRAYYCITGARFHLDLSPDHALFRAHMCTRAFVACRLGTVAFQFGTFIRDATLSGVILMRWERRLRRRRRRRRPDVSSRLFDIFRCRSLTFRWRDAMAERRTR